MTIINRYIRPIGDKIILKNEKLNPRLFYPYEIRYFQSGTAALAAAVIASIKLKPQTSMPEVILPAYGCPDLISAVIYAGARPMLTDLEPLTPWLSIGSIERRITENTVAIIAVNFLGLAERIKHLRTICEKNNLTLIEDSAQGFPKTTTNDFWRGDYNIVSFGRGKPVNLLAGGAVISSSQELLMQLPVTEDKSKTIKDNLCYILKIIIYNFIIKPQWYNLLVKLPWMNIGETRYKPLQSIRSMSASALNLLSSNIIFYQKKKDLASLYQNIISSLDKNKCINIARSPDEKIGGPYLRFPFLVFDKELRDTVYQDLKSLGASIMYQSALPAISGLDKIIEETLAEYPNAAIFSSSLLTLPTHEDVTAGDIQAMQTILTRYLGK